MNATSSRRPVWLRHDASLGHDIPGHPERPERLVALEAELAARDWFGWERVTAPSVEREPLNAVHPPEYVDALAALCARGGGRIDSDTATVADTLEAALRAAGGATALVDALLDGGAPTGVSALRPPGHHAEAARAMGFCFLNSVAVGARRARDAHGARRVLILDWDVHHGNGTNDIFHADDDVLFVSIHQSPLYPGTGPASDVGHLAGEGYTVNLPVPPGAGDATFRSLVEHVVVALAQAYVPELVLVSAGFDAHRADPLAGCEVTEEGFAAMTGSLRRVCAEIDAPLGLVLEGGYSVDALRRSVTALMPVLDAAEPPPTSAVDVDVAPMSAAAARRLEPWWPGLRAAVSSG